MSLKRRNGIAWASLLLAAVCWTLGWGMARSVPDAVTEETFVATTFLPPEWTTQATESSGPGETTPGREERAENTRGSRFLGYTLCFFAAAAAVIAVAGLWQTAPVLGPDGVCMLSAIGGTLYYSLRNMDYLLWGSTFRTLTTSASILIGFAILFSFRELWGWARAKCARSWCLIHRAVKRCTKQQQSLLVFPCWILLAFAGLTYHLIWYLQYGSLLTAPFLGFAAAAGFGFLCLWKYGADLEHFKAQLDNFQQARTITVGDGAFAQTEAQLLEVQARHEEAVRTAVTSERFKVELISNVSHDLRTPLTSILGYSELLEKESLSPEGREQLRRLRQKAGYMGDLVDALFELTKVSSGVVEAKKEKIDLIRLLEQTVGLFDDEISQAGLAVRRDYPAESIPIVTDGGRLHQVFANLLGNAIKYALQGTRIYLEVKETERGYLIRMMNTASYEMDFEPEEIMQRFARGDKARSTRGSGLGLAIAQTYTESVGGSFRVRVDGDQFSAIVKLPKTVRDL